MIQPLAPVFAAHLPPSVVTAQRVVLMAVCVCMQVDSEQMIQE